MMAVRSRLAAMVALEVCLPSGWSMIIYEKRDIKQAGNESV